MASNSCITSCEQLAAILKDPSWHERYRILNATWDAGDKDFAQDHMANRIPGSKFFAITECIDKESPYKLMLPPARQFEDYVSELGVSNNYHVIIYDNHSQHAVFSSARLWWMFRTFGHDNVSVLNGGLRRWVHEGYDVQCGDYTEKENLPRPAQKFKANFKSEMVRDYDFVQQNVKSDNPLQLLDCRGAFWFKLPLKDDGTEDPSSMIPAAKWTPFEEFLDNENYSVRPASVIQNIFSSRNINLDKGLVTYCLGGMLCPIVSLITFYATGKTVPLYDGSWFEWSRRTASQK